MENLGTIPSEVGVDSSIHTQGGLDEEYYLMHLLNALRNTRDEMNVVEVGNQFADALARSSYRTDSEVKTLLTQYNLSTPGGERVKSLQSGVSTLIKSRLH